MKKNISLAIRATHRQAIAPLAKQGTANQFQQVFNMIAARTDRLNNPEKRFFVRLNPRTKIDGAASRYFRLVEVKDDPTEPPDGLGRWFIVEICEGVTLGFFESNIIHVITAEVYEQAETSTTYNLSHATCQN